MMAETLVEKNTCKECGADVRPDTAFCYSCGKPVARPDNDRTEELSDAWFGETLAYDEPVAAPEQREIETVVKKTGPKTEATEIDPEAKTQVLDKPEGPDLPEIDPLHHSLPTDPGLKSAAQIRRKPKSYNRRDVEVVWEQHEKAPVGKFVLVTLVLVLFTLVVFFVAMQMK